MPLRYDLATASNDGARSDAGFDGKGNALPAEMLPAQVAFNDVTFELARATTGVPNAVIAKGQTIALPAGTFNRVYLLAASANGDQRTTFEIATRKAELNIQDWGGFIGQWDDRQWSSKETSHDDYGDMIGLKPAYIKRANLAWYCSHHHNAAGENVSYAYSYLFAYAIDAPSGARTIKLPNNNNVRILAISVADENPEVRPAQPLYDVLPSPNAGLRDFTLTASSASVSVSPGQERNCQNHRDAARQLQWTCQPERFRAAAGRDGFIQSCQHIGRKHDDTHSSRLDLTQPQRRSRLPAPRRTCRTRSQPP